MSDSRRTTRLVSLVPAILIVGIIGLPADAQFTSVSSGVVNVQHSHLAWGDYDADGDFDLAICGRYWDTEYQYAGNVYQNNSGAFTDAVAALTPASSGWLAWGDYDNDNDLDIALCGYYYDDLGDVHYDTRIHRNDGGGVFMDIGAPLHGVYSSCAAWGDVDNDGDLDLAVAGKDAQSNPTTRIYRNNKGTFEDMNAGVIGLVYADLSWCDYDCDGDLDLAVAGHYEYAPSKYTCKIYNNDNGNFTPSGVSLPDISGSLAWGDYDNDGDPDLAIAGYTPNGRIGRIYRNDGGALTLADSGIAAVDACTVAWGDYDNDGDLDLALMGSTWSNYDDGICRVYRNDPSGFSDIGAGLQGGYLGCIAWGDYDNDADLDLVYCGYNNSYMASTRLYRNDAAVTNTPPAPPTQLQTSFSGGSVTFSWNQGTDAQTPSLGLSYSLRVGTTPGGCDILSASADPSTGARYTVDLGNVQYNRSWTLTGLPAQTIYWSVQSVDNAFAGSAWATEASYDVPLAVVKAQPDGAGVVCKSAAVSASFDDFFYIESDDRSSGIRVRMPGHAIAMGTRLDVNGTMETNPDGERYIQASDVTPNGSGDILPVAIKNELLGGADWCYDDSTGAGQCGVTGGFGLNNIGLLVTTCGAFTYVDEHTFSVDDGCGVDLLCVVPDEVVLDPGWDFVAVTGISSCRKVSDQITRLLLPRDQQDIRTL